MDKLALTQFSASYMYYIEKHKLLDIISSLFAQLSVYPVENVRQWMGQNIRRIAQDIYSKALDSFHKGVPADYYQLPKNFFHRIVLHGRAGSGRHSLAHVLALRWNLLIIDANVLAYHRINGHQQDQYTAQLQTGIETDVVFKRSEAIGHMIKQRLLKDDALHRGWILINYPNNLAEARKLFEFFAVPPNRFIFLQIDEHMARMRLLMRNYTPSPQDNITYVDRLMQQFRKNESKLNDYLSNRREVLYIDATACFEAVKCQIMSQLTKTPYMLGYKYGKHIPLE